MIEYLIRIVTSDIVNRIYYKHRTVYAKLSLLKIDF